RRRHLRGAAVPVAARRPPRSPGQRDAIAPPVRLSGGQGPQGDLMASRELDGKRPVRAGAITIDAPGLTGELVAGRGRGPVSRGPDEDFPPALRKALTGRVRHEYQARILAPGEADTKG